MKLLVPLVVVLVTMAFYIEDTSGCSAKTGKFFKHNGGKLVLSGSFIAGSTIPLAGPAIQGAETRSQLDKQHAHERAMVKYYGPPKDMPAIQAPPEPFWTGGVLSIAGVSGFGLVIVFWRVYAMCIHKRRQGKKGSDADSVC